MQFSYLYYKVFEKKNDKSMIFTVQQQVIVIFWRKILHVKLLLEDLVTKIEEIISKFLC